MRTFEETSPRTDADEIRKNLRTGGRKRDTVHMQTSLSITMPKQKHWELVLLYMHAIMKIDLNPKIPAGYVLQFGIF